MPRPLVTPQVRVATMATGGAHRPMGLSLMELLFTVALLSILLALGIPAFTSLIASTRLSNATNTLIGHLQYARSEAVKRGRDRVAVGPHKPDMSWLSSQSWEGGYVIAAVDNASPPNMLGIGVLRRVDGADLASFTVKKNGTSPRFIFYPDGSASGIGTLTICDRNNVANKRGVTVDLVGRIRVTDYAAGTGAVLACP